MWISLFFVLYVLPLVTCYHANLQDQLNADFAENIDNDEREFRDAYEKDRRKKEGHPFHNDWKESRMKARDEFRSHDQDNFRSNEENGEVAESVFVKRGFRATELTGLQTNAVQAHNTARGRHENTPPVSYSSVLEDHAIAYAMKLAESGTFTHDKNELNSLREGENLYKGYSDDPRMDICTAVYKWYNEIRLFDYQKLPMQYNFLPAPEIGHFTQIVWKSSTQIGCGGAYITSNDRRGKFIVWIVCRYKKPGNVVGQFPANVKHPKLGNSKHGFSSYDELCSSCADNRSDCASRSGQCDSSYFPEITTGCQKTCGKC